MMACAVPGQKEPNRAQLEKNKDEKAEMCPLMMILAPFNLVDEAIHFRVKAVAVGTHLSVWEKDADAAFVMDSILVPTFVLDKRPRRKNISSGRHILYFQLEIKQLKEIRISGGSHHGQEPILVMSVLPDAAAEMRDLIQMPSAHDRKSPFFCPLAEDEAKRLVIVICEPKNDVIGKVGRCLGRLEVGAKKEPLLKHMSKEDVGEILARVVKRAKVSRAAKCAGELPALELPASEIPDSEVPCGKIPPFHC